MMQCKQLNAMTEEPNLQVIFISFYINATTRHNGNWEWTLPDS